MNSLRNQAVFPYLGINDFFEFPNPEHAEKNGIVAIGGNLSPGMLKSAYMQGIFPWFNDDDPILWWSPSPRFVLFPNELHVPNRLERFLRQNPFSFTANSAFERVICACAHAKRNGQRGTWITNDVIHAYIELHKAGYAHSFEARQNGEIVGGFYGVLLGGVFVGESMFASVPEAAKSAFCRFVKIFAECGGVLVDSQVYTDNIARFGGKNISRDVFLHLEKQAINTPLVKNLFELYYKV